MNTSVGILDILNSAEKLVSVGFSSGYNYNETKAADYFDELMESANVASPIFSGIMIMEKSNDANDGCKILTVVDGIQRLTTLSLLLCAMCECFRDTSQKNDEAGSKIFRRYLACGDDTKLSIGEEDKIFSRIIFREPVGDYAQSNLVATYKTFLTKIKSGKVSPTQLFKIISQIRFLVVYNENTGIPGRELYQALNKNKNDLSQLNLISDYIFQKDTESGLIWQKTVNLYKSLGLMIKLKSFIQDFLTIQNNGKVPLASDLYVNFRMYFDTMMNFQPSQKTVENICKYAQNYLKIIQSDFEDFEIKKMFISINENRGQDSYSYLMEVLDDLQSGHIEKDVFFDILTMINAFVVERIENEQTPETMNFANLSRELNKMLVLKVSELTPEDDDNYKEKLTINKINQI